jgi:hypothetical protein
MNRILAWCSPNARPSIKDSNWLADNAEQLQ